MKIKRWVIGISALICIEVLLFLVLTVLLPEKTTAGGHRGVIRQATVDPVYQGKDAEYQMGEGKRGDRIAGVEDETGEGSQGDRTTEQDNETGGEGNQGIRKAGKSGKTKDSGKQQGESVSGRRAAGKNLDGETERQIYRKNKKNLVLVNAQHAMQDSYDPSLRSICNGREQASKRIYSSLVQMLADAEEQGYHFWIASAYRSREKQQRLVEEDVRRAMEKGMSYQQAWRETCKETMPAGHSEHQTGLALDILCSGNMKMDTSQKREPGNRWLRENCSRYGFILRYPEDKSEITGVSFEPWHFRYVGRQAAEYMQEQEITLEEFWERMG